MIPDVKKTDCCGCQACMNACPVSCIEMKPDEEFFLYPHIDSEKCVHCHACERVCPALNKNLPENTENKKVYACWNPDMDKRINSTSGGVVSVLSEKIISEGGCVVGAYYRDDFTVAHMIGATEQEILKLRQSKYMQSDMGLIYKAVGELLKEGKKVLFCGTPCHNAALRNYLRVVPDNLFQCDFICRGVISPGVFKEYLSYLEKKYKGKAVKVQFKNKDYGWNRFSTKAPVTYASRTAATMASASMSRPPLMLLRERSQAVIQVPIFAPMIRLRALSRSMMPEPSPKGWIPAQALKPSTQGMDRTMIRTKLMATAFPLL